MTRRLLCAGEVVVDLVLEVETLPRRGGDVIARAFAATPGGALNVMTAARRQGVPVTYAGLVGTGPMATLAGAALAAEGIDVPLPQRADSDTATVLALVEGDGERTFITTLGAEADLTDEDLAAVTVRDDDVVYVSGYGLAYPVNGPVLSRWVPGLPPGVTVVLDPGPLVGQIPAAVLEPVLDRTGWVTCTGEEAVAITGGPASPAELAVALRRRVQVGAVVRQGRLGATVCAYDHDPCHVDAFDVTPVDRNGAGDAHTGTLIAVIASSHNDFDELLAVRRANAAAALAITRRGPATSPVTAEIDSFLDDAAAQPRSNG